MDAATSYLARRLLMQKLPVLFKGESDSLFVSPVLIQEVKRVSGGQPVRRWKPGEDGVSFEHGRCRHDEALSCRAPLLEVVDRPFMMFVPSAHRGDEATGIKDDPLQTPRFLPAAGAIRSRRTESTVALTVFCVSNAGLPSS